MKTTDEKFDIYDLYYDPTGSVKMWHYELSFKREYMHHSWILISKNQHTSKLSLFTDYFIPMKFGGWLSDIEVVPKAIVIKSLWYDYEILIEALNQFEISGGVLPNPTLK